MPPSVVPSFSDCRQAARVVRKAEHGRESLDVVRPRGVSGLFRARPPLAVVLYRAAREDRLLWWSPRNFALLEPPGDPLTASYRASRWLRLLDRWWDLLIFLFLPALLLATAALVGLPPDATAARTIAALLLALAAMTWVVVLMTAVTVRGFLSLYRLLIVGRPRELTDLGVDQLLTGHWSVPLCQLADPRLVNGLVDAAYGRAVRYHETSAAQEEPSAVLCMERGVTTTTAREVLRAHPRVRPLSATLPVLVFGTDGTGGLPEPDTMPRLAERDIPLWLGTMMMGVVAAIAAPVAAWERAACQGAECRERPVTYPDALYWLLNRVFGGDPEGLGAATFAARSLGLLVTLMSVVIIGWVVVVVVSLLQQAMARTPTIGRDLARSFNQEPTQPIGATAAGDPALFPFGRSLSTDPTPNTRAKPLDVPASPLEHVHLLTAFTAGLAIGALATRLSGTLRRSVR